MQIPRILLISLVLLAALSLACDAHAREVAGVDVPETATLGAAKDKIVLNGAGIRKKYRVVKVYVGALYLKEKTTDVSKAVSMPGAKRVLMHFLYKKVEAAKINSGWEDGFRANLKPAEYSSLQARLNKFKGLFSDMKKGDRILLDYVPGTGTEVRINGTLAGSIEGEDFFRALLLVWLGDVPADKGLKQGMLGG
ncbi:MAG: chalcone isomerase family protein [Thermodesulfovibrionales bacterium]|nr:chalcone isomerase family protein [Thermodesulfovibrionales bacterium]